MYLVMISTQTQQKCFFNHFCDAFLQAMLHRFDGIKAKVQQEKPIFDFEFKRWKFQNILATTGKLLRSRKGAGHPHDSVGESVQAEEAELQQGVPLDGEEKEEVQAGQAQDLQLLQLVAAM